MTINSANPYQNLTLSNPLQNSSALNLIKDSKALDQEGNENSLEQLSYILTIPLMLVNLDLESMKKVFLIKI